MSLIQSPESPLINTIAEALEHHILSTLHPFSITEGFSWKVK